MARANNYDCIVIGAGPGGLTAAVYLARLHRSVLVVESGSSRLKNVPKLGNAPGYRRGVSGKRLLERMREQVHDLKVRVIQGLASVRAVGKGYQVKVGPRRLTATKIVIATGMKDRDPPIHNSAELCRSGLLAYCPICDGYDHSKQKIGVIVDHVDRFKEVDFLRTFSPDLHVFAIQPLGLSRYRQALLKQQGIHYYEGPIEFCKPAENPRRLCLKLKGHVREYVDLAYVALGVDVPDNAIRKLNLVKTPRGFVRVDAHQETSCPGVFAVGDCVESLSQVSVAIGHAAIAATTIHNKLRNEFSARPPGRPRI